MRRETMCLAFSGMFMATALSGIAWYASGDQEWAFITGLSTGISIAYVSVLVKMCQG